MSGALLQSTEELTTLTESLETIAPVKTRTLEDFKQFLLNFLPIGILWNFFNDTFHSFMETWAVEFNTNDQRTIDLQREVIPGLSVEILPQWEADVLAPDELPDGTETIAERQLRVQSKLYNTPNNPTAKFWNKIANDRNVYIAISFPVGAFRVDVSRVESRLKGPESKFIWIVDYVSGAKTEYSKLEATFRRLSPAWQFLTFNSPPP